MWRYLRLKLISALSGLIAISLAGVAAGFMLLHHYGRDLPDYQTLAEYEPPIVSRVYAANGALIGEFAAEKRVFVPYDMVPPRVVNAFVAAEDSRFFVHPGFDVHGILRALRANLAGGVQVQGGSTITQQVAKNMLLTPERSLDRKIRELILSIRIERAYSKEKILELYLNEIFLGRQAYGIAAAAQAYFHKSLGELTVAEAALLAGLPRAPSRFNPERRTSAARARRNYVIQRMREDGYISDAEAAEAAGAPLGVKPPPRYLNAGAEYFVEDVRRAMIAQYGAVKSKSAGFVVRATIDPRLQAFADTALRNGLMGYDRRHGWRGPIANLGALHGEVWRDGWRRKLHAVKAPAGNGAWPLAVVINVEAAGADIALADGRSGTIPLAELAWARKQGDVATEPGKPKFRTAVGPVIRRASDVLKPGDVILVERIAADAAGKPLPPHTYALRQVPEVTGALVAMDPHTGRVLAMTGGFSFWLSQFNNATQAERQPGSSFKPYVYLAALQEGFTPGTIVLDAPIAIRVGDKIYQPRNYSGEFYGLTTMRTAIEHSRNVVAVRMAEATGLKVVAELATRLGVSDHLRPALSLALGAFETTPMRQATAYAMIANGGRRIVPTLIDRIQDRYGKTVYRHDARPCAECAQAAFKGQSAPALPNAQEPVLDEANAYQMISMLEGAVQRGTGVALKSLGRPVAGKTGTTNDYMDAWFVGFTPDLVVSVWIGFDKPRTLGKTETGGVTAAPIARDFFRDALEGTPKREFVRPKSVVAVVVGHGTEYYKLGTEPGTGKGRTLDNHVAENPLVQVGRGVEVTY